MSILDWVILCLTLGGIVAYGIYKSRTQKHLEGYFLTNRSMPWFLVLLSIMGTQASAITYLSGPGQAYTDGMRFVQYYFGLPLAMIVVAYFFLPVYARMKVFTPYEFLEKRFDLKTRTLTAFLFLLSRGLSTGISIYAPSIILCSLMGWNIYLTNIITGGILIIYTVSGGAGAVAHTQKVQMIIIFAALFLIGYIAVNNLPQGLGFADSIRIATENGKMNVITTGMKDGSFDWKDKYNIWSGLIGGFFLALSYFGTDHSQVGRYLTAKSEAESRKGLLMNGLVKVPMQFLILLLGILIFTFYLYNPKPSEFTDNSNYIFLQFVKDNLPAGLIGLLFAIIFLSAWGSIAAALNALAACTMIDFQKRFQKSETSPETDYRRSKWYTFGWGIFCIIIAMFADTIGNSLIEAVNILGSLFYGVILGIFLVAFWLKKIKGQAVFFAALLSEIAVVAIYFADVISFLWLNVIGALMVILIGSGLQKLNMALVRTKPKSLIPNS